MKVKLLSVLLAVSIFACTCSCSCSRKKPTTISGTEHSKQYLVSTDPTEETYLDTEDTSMDYIPDVIQIQSICQLAVMECYYHNVAKGVVEAGTGFLHWGEQDTPFWVEYSAYVSLGIDFNQVSLTTMDNEITVRMPHASVLGEVRVDTNTIGDPIYAPHNWYNNDVDIPAEYITRAIAMSNDQLLESINSDTAVLDSAETRAEELITNYIDQIMALGGVDDYRIVFSYIGDTEVEE